MEAEVIANDAMSTALELIIEKRKKLEGIFKVAQAWKGGYLTLSIMDNTRSYGSSDDPVTCDIASFLSSTREIKHAIILDLDDQIKELNKAEALLKSKF